MHLLLIWLFCSAATALPSIQVPGETPVYQAPQPGARVLFILRTGDSLQRLGTAVNGFVKVTAINSGRKRVGYVDELDLEPSDHGFLGTQTWGFGGGWQYTSLRQGARAFQDTDQVTYSTSPMTGSSTAPFFVLQLGLDSFWRLTAAQKALHFTGTAHTNVAGAPTQTTSLDYSFISLMIQRAWTPFDIKAYYMGLGFEYGKATSVSLKFSGSTIPTSSENFPTYYGAQGFFGARTRFTKSLSGYAELSFAAVVNQAPAIYSLEGSLGVLWWPQFK